MRATLHEHQMLTRGDHVLVAVSGGGDSMALLHFLLQTPRLRGIQVSAFHLNHRLRGRDANADEASVRRYCATLGAPLIVHREAVAQRAKRDRLSLEEAGRTARYVHLEAVRRQIGATKIATAHTATDNAETVLMRVLQGTSLDGLMSIPPVRDRIIRPFIAVTREQVRDYAAHHEIPFREDSSNRDPRFLRNRIRHRLIPLIQKEVNPQVIAALNRLAVIASRHRSEREQSVQLYAKRYARKGILSHLVLELDESMQDRITREWLRQNGITPNFATIRRILALWKQPRGTAAPVPGGARVYRDAEYLSLVPPDELSSQVSLAADTTPAEGFKLPPNVPLDEAYLDADQVAGEPRIRYWSPGDRFHPLGAPGSMKLQDFFVNQKVPIHLKSRIPLVVDDERTLWVVGYRISEVAKITPRTCRILHLKCLPTDFK